MTPISPSSQGWFSRLAPVVVGAGALVSSLLKADKGISKVALLKAKDIFLA